jgi:catalase
MSAPQPAPGIGEQLVDVQRTLAGPHPGFRSVHAKGLLCHGTFRGSADAPRVTRAEHFQGQPLPAIIRFSNFSGNPNVHDGEPNVRAMSVKFALSTGRTADILANIIPVFPSHTPQEFLAFLQTFLPDPATGQPDGNRLPRFLAAHPAEQTFVKYVGEKGIPVSFAQAGYHALHAFRFTAADGSSRFGRYHWLPEGREAFLSPEEGSRRDPNFLRNDLDGRLRQGPVSFRLTLQLGASGDPTNDPTVLWPADRPVVELGRLDIHSIAPDGLIKERELVFDPANRTDGIDLSDDPVLLVRSAAYSLSYDRRSQGL